MTKPSAVLAPGETEDGWQFAYWTDLNNPFFFRKDGDTLTFRATFKSRGGGGWIPSVPVAVEINGQSFEVFAYLDTGTVKTYVPPSIVEAAGLSLTELPDGGTMNGYLGVRECAGRIMLSNGRPLLEDGFNVAAQEPNESIWAWGAAFILGLDAMAGWDVCFQWRDAEPGASELPVFTLTPRT